MLHKFIYVKPTLKV